MKGLGVEVSSVRPYEGMDFRVYLYLFEQVIVLQRSVQFADKYRLEIDDLFLIVVENHPERIGSENLIPHYSVDGMFHSIFSKKGYRSGAILYGSLPDWSLSQFSSSSP